MANIITSTLVTLAVAGGLALGLYEPETEMSNDLGEAEIANNTYVELDLIAVPFVADKKVHGYLISRFTLKLNDNSFEKYGEALIPRINDVVNTELFVRLAELRKTKPYEVEEVVGEALTEAVNREFGATIAHGVFVNQLEYLNKDSVRTPREAAAEAGQTQL